MMVAEDAPPDAGSGRPRRVLLVEDEPLIRFATAEHLRGRGLEVIEAADGDEARLVLRAFRVDAVVTDVQMPGATDGLALAKWIAAHRPGLRMLLISAVPPSPDRSIASVDWPAIAKPYRLEVLERRIVELFAGA